MAISLKELLELAAAKHREQAGCVHEYAPSGGGVGPATYRCRKCGYPMDDSLETPTDCIQIEPRVFTPKRFYRQDG